MASTKRVSSERGRRSREDPTGVVSSRRRLTTTCSERRALMRADAILRCVAFALEYADWRSDDPDYAEAIEAACSLISQSIGRLESHPDLTTGPVRSDSESSA
jgi:hypothetical protein